MADELCWLGAPSICVLQKNGTSWEPKLRTAAYTKGKREKAKAAKGERKKAATGKRIVTKMLGEMISPKTAQCDRSDLDLTDDDCEGWEFCHRLPSVSICQYVQQEFLAGVIPAVLAHMVFNEDWVHQCHVPHQCQHADDYC